MQWTDLTDADPRLADLETAAGATLLTHADLWSDHVYVMAKPYIEWLVGWKRGRPIGKPFDPAPPGSALALFAASALPFTADLSPLDGQHAYTVTCLRIRERLYDLQNIRAA